jgi:hypothetical protein
VYVGRCRHPDADTVTYPVTYPDTEPDAVT